VLADRMVADYVGELYAPSARGSRSLEAAADRAGAKDLAAWKQRVAHAWHAVRVDHVESGDVADSPQVGDPLRVDAYVSLGDLAPEDVCVELVHGRTDDSDALTDTRTAALGHAESYEGGRHKFSATIELRRTGSFGYTVRVLPTHAALASVAEMGLVANAG